LQGGGVGLLAGAVVRLGLAGGFAAQLLGLRVLKPERLVGVSFSRKAGTRDQVAGDQASDDKRIQPARHDVE